MKNLLIGLCFSGLVSVTTVATIGCDSCPGTQCEDKDSSKKTSAVTSEHVANQLGIGEPEAAILLDDSGFVPTLNGDELLYKLTDSDLEILAVATATE